MNGSDPVPDYDILDLALVDAGSVTEAAETHGIICGAACAPKPGGEWLDVILDGCDDPAASAGLTAQLRALFVATRGALEARDASFTLYLPDDTQEFGQRVAAVAGWCRGFLLGLTAAGVEDLTALPGDAAEIVADVGRIARLAPESEEGGDDEAALTEVEEYLRVAVQLVFEELAAVRPV